MKTQHTPGPWNETSRDITTSIGGESLYIARCFSKGEPQPGWRNPGCTNAEAKANARLIAAAPETAAERDKLKELNAVLVDALENFPVTSPNNLIEAIASWYSEVALVAVKKAKGE